MAHCNVAIFHQYTWQIHFFACRSAPIEGRRPSGDGTLSLISPIAIRMTWTALPITSAGRRSPLGPLGIRVILKNGFNQPLKLALARTYTRPSEIGGYFDFFCAAICRSTATDLYMRPFMLDVESLVLGIER